MPLPTIKPARPPVRRKPHRSVPPAALTLTAASVDKFMTLTLSFDRAIDIASIRVASIRVGTIVSGDLYQGSGPATLVDARTVRVTLTDVGPYEPSNTMLMADADNGIVAADDGGAWAGTSGTALPFP